MAMNKNLINVSTDNCTLEFELYFSLEDQTIKITNTNQIHIWGLISTDEYNAIIDAIEEEYLTKEYDDKLYITFKYDKSLVECSTSRRMFNVYNVG